MLTESDLKRNEKLHGDHNNMLFPIYFEVVINFHEFSLCIKYVIYKYNIFLFDALCHYIINCLICLSGFINNLKTSIRTVISWNRMNCSKQITNITHT